jgi:tetratricopeptide (TPR) repeat protein
MEVQKDIQERELLALYHEAQELMSQYQMDCAMVKLDAVLIKAKKCNNIEYIGRAFSLKGFLNYRRNETNHAINFYEKAVEIFSQNIELFNDELKQVKNSLGVLYTSNGELGKSLENLFYSVELAEKNSLSKATSFNNIALVYHVKGDYIKAINFFKLSISEEEMTDKPSLSHCMSVNVNIGGCYVKVGQLEEAFDIFSKTLKQCEQEEEFRIMIQCLKGLALVFLEKGDYKNAEICLKKAIKLSSFIDYRVHMVEILIILSDLYQKIKNHRDQFSTLKKALKLAERAHRQKVVLVLEALKAFHLDRMNYKEVGSTLRRILALKEAAFEKEKKEKLLDLQNMFESKQKDKLILQEHAFQQKLEVKQRRLKAALAEQKAMDLHLKSLQLQLSPHFIFNTLQSIQSFIFEKDPIQASDYLAKFASLMRAILNASRQGALSLFEEQQLLSQYLDLEQKRFSNQFAYKIEMDENLPVDEFMIPSLLLQPFVENAIIHGVSGLKNGEIRVVFKKFGQNLYVHILDNGLGRKASNSFKNKKNTGNSTALKIMTERAVLSKDSIHYNFDFKIKDRRFKRKVQGTHVVLRIEPKEKSLV